MTSDDAKKITQNILENIKFQKLTLARAKIIIDKAEKEANKINVPMVITVVDEGGNLIAQHRMDNALIASIDISLSKAYTSLALKMSTEELSQLVLPGKSLYGIINNSKYCAFGGGIPIICNGNIIGAVGVSGGSVDEDVHVAKASIENEF